LIGILSIGLCLFGGVLFGHPSAGLIAGGGAFTIGFGVNQRIADSRLWPMIAATAAVFLSTMIGMLVGHRGFTLVLAAAIWGFTYGILTARAAGISWVGQQSAITLFVASAFPANFHFTLLRSLLIGGGGALQILITSICLRLLPELAANLRAIRQTSSEELSHLFSSNFARYRMLLRLRALPENLLHIPTFPFAIRMSLTVAISAEVYRHLGVQSGYWIPMTALLVQKPAFSETFSRAFLRVGGTLAGAVLSTIFLIHIRPDPYYLAALTTFFALWSYATNTVNYGLAEQSSRSRHRASTGSVHHRRWTHCTRHPRRCNPASSQSSTHSSSAAAVANINRRRSKRDSFSAPVRSCRQRFDFLATSFLPIPKMLAKNLRILAQVAFFCTHFVTELCPQGPQNTRNANICVRPATSF